MVHGPEALRLFKEIDSRLLADTAPSQYLNSLESPLFNGGYPFIMLSELKEVGQSPRYHPEGSVWNHTMLVVDAAARMKERSSDSRVFMWAALLHDIGKAQTTRTRKGKITSYDHDKTGAQMAREFLGAFGEREDFVKKVAALVRWHMQILFVADSKPFADIQGMKSETDVNNVALLGLCDRLGRGGADREEEEENIKLFLKRVSEHG